jgi:hypothetical protein
MILRAAKKALALQPNIVKLLGFEILAAGKNLFF